MLNCVIMACCDEARGMTASTASTAAAAQARLHEGCLPFALLAFIGCGGQAAAAPAAAVSSRERGPSRATGCSSGGLCGRRPDTREKVGVVECVPPSGGLVQVVGGLGRECGEKAVVTQTQRGPLYVLNTRACHLYCS